MFVPQYLSSVMSLSLTAEQKCVLADSVAREAGINLDFKTFTDAVLLLFEDVPGFEVTEPGLSLLREIWAIYNQRSTDKPQPFR
jgi:hypothetical protein